MSLSPVNKLKKKGAQMGNVLLNLPPPRTSHPPEPPHPQILAARAHPPPPSLWFPWVSSTPPSMVTSSCAVSLVTVWYWDFVWLVSPVFSALLCFSLWAKQQNMAATFLAFCVECYWCSLSLAKAAWVVSDWLKWLGWLAGQNPLLPSASFDLSLTKRPFLTTCTS